MLKRVALFAGSVAALLFARQKARQQAAEQELWTQATDDVRATPAPAPAPAPKPAATAPIDEPPTHS